jgi:hypothetical protein
MAQIVVLMAKLGSPKVIEIRTIQGCGHRFAGDRMRQLHDHADAVRGAAAPNDLYQTCHEGSDATYLRRQYEERGCSEGMVDAAIGRFREDM